MWRSISALFVRHIKILKLISKPENFELIYFIGLMSFPLLCLHWPAGQSTFQLVLAAMLKSGKPNHAGQPVFTEGAHAEMMRYPWPGNVREFEM